MIYCFGHHGFHVEECLLVVIDEFTPELPETQHKRSQAPNDHGDSSPEFRL